MSGEGLGLVRRSRKSRWWQVEAAKVSDRGESEGHPGVEETASKWSYFGLEGSGWLGVDERMGSKCVRAAERTGGEPKVAEQPLQLPGR